MDDEKPIWKVSSAFRANARALRRTSTDAERILWSELRDHRLQGVGFRRQVPIDHCIADFVCHSAKLVIEIDGRQHFSDDGERADVQRSAVIEAKGFKVQSPKWPIGGAQAIWIDWEHGTLLGGSDPRKDGCALGF